MTDSQQIFPSCPTLANRYSARKRHLLKGRDGRQGPLQNPSRLLRLPRRRDRTDTRDRCTNNRDLGELHDMLRSCVVSVIFTGLLMMRPLLEMTCIA